MASTAPDLRALIVADVVTYRERLAAELTRGMECRLDFADTPQEVRRKLDSETYDFVVAAYRLEGWRGTEVLSETSRRGLDVPVILVTAQLGEEFADECLRAGASDFVLEPHLSRLPGAVRRALAEKRIKESHAEVLERNRRLSVALDQSPASVFITDPEGRIEYVNRRFTQITGYAEHEVIGQNPRVLQSGKTPLETYEKLWSTVKQGGIWRNEILNRRKNGELYWSDVSISPVENAAGEVTHFVAVHEDISERRWAEETIREREERFRQIADNIHEVFWVVSADFGEMLYVSPAYEEVWGRSCRTLYEEPASFMQAIHSDDRPGVIRSVTRLREGERPSSLDFRVTRPDGTIRWVRARAAPVLDDEGNVYRISGVALDITEHKIAEERVRSSEERFRKLVDASFDVIVQSVDGVFTEVSAGFEEMFGYAPSEILGRPLVDVVAPESRDEVLRRARGGIEGRYELVGLHKDGSRLVIEAAGKFAEVDGRSTRISALRDITAQRSLEEQLRQSQKLEAVGRLAGGVAHDFNNVLTVILTEIQLLRMTANLDERSGLASSLSEIEQAARRAAGLTRQLLTFSRHDVAEPRVLSPNEVIEGLKKMLARLIGEDVSLEVSRDPDVGNVYLDQGLLEQVIVNLVVNARDAMPEGGQIRIEVRNALLDEAYAQQRPEVRAGEYVLIAVSDTGTGMSRETQERLFEPFFTTKEAGKGTGLGLATSYGIVKDAGGHFGVYSELGLGTTMKVYLARVDGPEATRAEAHSDELGIAPLRANVLVVEDEDAVRRIAVRTLEALGCSVIAATTGTEALDVLRRGRDTIDLLFTDVVMPGMGGPELVAQAKAMVPELKVLYTTGYTADMALRLRLVREQAPVLAKPYTVAELAEKLRMALRAETRGG